MKTKLPPKELDIEERIISSILINDDYRKRICDLLDTNDFYVSAHKVIFDKCREMGINGHPIDIPTLWAALDEDQSKIIGNQHKLASYLDVPVATDIDYYISILKDQAVRRRSIELVNSIQKRCDRKGSDLNNVVRDAKAIIEEVEGSFAGYQKSSFEFIHNDQIIENLKPVVWRIQGIMENNSFYYDFGDAGHLKTFVGLDRLLCVATGKDYHGHPVKQGTVFYIAGEGQQGIGRRIAAWHINNGTKAKDVPFFVAKTPTQLMDPEAVDQVKRAVDILAAEYGHPAIIHIDTLARNFGDGDENSTKDMNRVISNLDTAFGADIGRGLTHHTGHLNKERARGSIALHGAADAAFRIRHLPDGTVLVECKKMKDAPPAPPMLFVRNEIKLVIGDHHDQSFVLELESEGEDVCIEHEANLKNISNNMQRSLNLLNQMYANCEKNLAADGRQGHAPHVSRSDWRKACMQSEIYKRTDVFDKAVNRMFHRGLLQADDSGYYIYPIEIYRKYNSEEMEPV
jgi:hypothetical protein